MTDKYQVTLYHKYGIGQNLIGLISLDNEEYKLPVTVIQIVFTTNSNILDYSLEYLCKIDVAKFSKMRVKYNNCESQFYKFTTGALHSRVKESHLGINEDDIFH